MSIVPSEREGEEMSKIGSLYVHRCHHCGKPVTPEPTSLETTDDIMILCSECAEAREVSGEKPKIACEHQWIPYRGHVSSTEYTVVEEKLWKPIDNLVITVIKCVKCGKEEKLKK